MQKTKLCKCGCGQITNQITHTNNNQNKIKGEYYDFLIGHHSKNKPKSISQKIKMSESRKEWYAKNPIKSREKTLKMQTTKILNGTHVGKNNSNYGSHVFKGISYKGVAWNKGLTKETNPTLKEISNQQQMEKNHRWKGNNIGKKSVHNWLRKHNSAPQFCEICYINSPYDLANKSGKYKRDINDFKWLCRSCHMKEDGRILNLKNQ